MEEAKDEFTATLRQMQSDLHRVSVEHSERTWLQAGKTTLNEKLRGDKSLTEMAKEAVDFLVSYAGAQVGSLYAQKKGVFNLEYSHGTRKQTINSFEPGDGLVGQVARDQTLKTFNNIPNGYFKIESSLGGERPDTTVIVPAVLDNKTIGVVELAKFGDFSPLQLKFLNETSESIAIFLSAALNQQSLKELLEEIQSQKMEMEKTALELAQQVGCLNNAAIVSIADANGDIIYVNDTFCKISKYSREELLGKNHRILKSGKQPDGLFVGMWKAISMGRVWNGEILNKAKDGSFYWVDTTITPFKNLDGKIEKYVAIRFDITAAKNQKTEMEKTSLELAQQVDCLNNAAIVSIADAQGDIIYVNDTFCKISKYSREELIGKNHRILKSGKQPQGLFVGIWKAISTGRVWSGEILNKAKDGSFYWVDTTITPFKGVDGKIEKYVAIRFDITLRKTQAEELAKQSEELRTQQDDMKQLNEELEEQTQNLKQQQDELQTANEELEEQTQSLEARNKEIEEARQDVEQKTKQLELSSRYKSEFLANMSHELRTPLNSLLILAKDLSENKTQNLSPNQVESAEIIYNSGHDLLTLINEVLDLSKIEAGKMVITVERIWLNELLNAIQRDFRHQAEKKGLTLTANLEGDLPEFIRTDPLRLNQILKNLLSNAIKFTEIGSVIVTLKRQDADKLAIAVADTGIGIPEEKRMAIFEAFQQVDGGTSRKYGGTGLGLSISRELAKLLEGEIELESKVNSGSTFTLIIPLEITATHYVQKERVLETRAPTRYTSRHDESNSRLLNYPGTEDDRNHLEKDDKVVLIIDDDLKFADIVIKQARSKGFKVLSAATGENGLALAARYKPHAIILDLDLPGISGLHVLAELKANPDVRHIPVHIVSVDERSLKPIKDGAVEFLTKPIDKTQMEATFRRIENFVSRKMKKLLIVEDDENARKAMRKLIGNGDVKCLEASTGKEALKIYKKEEHIDCIVLDIGLEDMSGFDLIYMFEKEKTKTMPPIIIYTGRELTKEENNELERYAEAIIIKGIKSEERLLDETALFLHRTVSNLPETQRRMIATLYDKEGSMKHKKILLVDDDMRNVFALSKILKDRGMEVLKAENGKVAIDMLNNEPGIHLVLMDIMMPEMDGYEAMQKIRAQEKFKVLPIIALTAKAMKDDRQKCINAGANDYISKPVDTERLLSLMRVWLSK
ncbi:MAG: response regulator [Bacteroidota bacterium]